MYSVLIILWGLVGLLALSRGFRLRSPARLAAGVTILAAMSVFFWLLDFWGEMLWFEALGFQKRFWTAFWTQVGCALAGGVFGALLLFLLARPAFRRRVGLRFLPTLVGGAVGLAWGQANWDRVLLWLHGVSTEVRDPILNLDSGFYLFSLPFYDRLWWLAAILSLAGMAFGSLSFLKLGFPRKPALKLRRLKDGGDENKTWRWSLGLAALVLGWGVWLETYHLLYSTWGAVTGPGWTDVTIRLPAFRIVAVLTLLLGAALIVSAWTGGRFLRFSTVPAMAVLAVVWLLGLALLPWLVQRLAVEPNEITFEKPYIAHNIRFTRVGFGLDRAEEQEYPISGEFGPEVIEANRQLLSEIRLWDWRALKAVHKQFQEIRLYYEFSDVDIDRYSLGGRYRQVMVSAREMELDNLPEQSRTFVNEKFKYTHGYGLTMTPVSEFTDEGLPNFLIKDIPPQAAYPELAVERPQIYFGELTTTPAYVNTSEEEFDYPRGDQNAYIRYPGSGGVELESLWDKFVFGWKFDGSRLFFSAYPREGSRVLFHRQVRERVRTVAPFLEFDEDPYIVLSGGALFWIVDGYTVSRYFPYSEPFSSKEIIEYSEGTRPRHLASRVNPDLDGANYVRNSVKAVVDAFNGTVKLYVFEPGDPLIQAWQRAFPGLFEAQGQMPEDLRAHIRYPADFLLTQGIVYAKYHMSDPEVFYNQEDLWVRATEKYYSGVQPVEPYYVMWKLPGSDQSEFALILPFTPKNRQVMIGWMAGMCDPGDYGRLLVYKFPKEKTVLGPQQVETKIDQDRFLSGQLTLWDQRGSHVIRGNVLVIPIQGTLLYVEPIYLQAETAAYPELRLVAAMHGEQLSYAGDFQGAIEGLFKPSAAEPAAPLGREDLAASANQTFEEYLRLFGEGDFAGAADRLEKLRGLLQRMASEGGGQ